MCADFASTSGGRSAVPDVLAPGLRAIFCGINPGRVSAAARAHFANPCNDFWRLLHDAGLTPRALAPAEQFELLDFGFGLTNAAHRTTPGSGDLRSADFAGAAERLARMSNDLRPLAIAFVGKEAYRGVFGEHAELGPQRRTLGDVGLFVLPSTSPANAAIPYSERLRWFSALRDWLLPVDRPAARALVLDRHDRILLVEFKDDDGQVWWATPGGGIGETEDAEQALRRELAEEIGLVDAQLGPELWTRDATFAWNGRILHTPERIWLVRVDKHEVAPRVDLSAENVSSLRWWTLDELDATREELVPRRLPELVRTLLRDGPSAAPIDAGL